MSTGDGATIEFDWGDGPHKFCLKLKQIRELQAKCNAGIMDIMTRLREDHWWGDDPRDVIRLGLMGAGMGLTEALVLVTRFVDDRPLKENVWPAFLIIAAAVTGVKGDQPGKATAEEPTTTTDGSASPPSTVPGPSLDGLHEMLMN